MVLNGANKAFVLTLLWQNLSTILCLQTTLKKKKGHKIGSSDFFKETPLPLSLILINQ